MRKKSEIKKVKIGLQQTKKMTSDSFYDESAPDENNSVTLVLNEGGKKTEVILERFTDEQFDAIQNAFMRMKKKTAAAH